MNEVDVMTDVTVAVAGTPAMTFVICLSVSHDLYALTW